MPRQAPALEIYDGTVTKVNAKGFQLTGYGQDWFNVSQYADPMPELPVVGERVQAGVDGKGFVYSIDLMETGQGPHGPQPRQGPQQQRQGPPQRSPQPQSGAQAPRGDSWPSPAPTATPSASELTREQRARALALETARQFLASRPDAKARDVLTVANVWVAWILTGQLPQAASPTGQRAPQPPEEVPAS